MSGQALVTIGDVGVKEPSAKCPTALLGDERQAVLRLLKWQDGCRYVPCDLRSGQGYRELAWSEIDWEGVR